MLCCKAPILGLLLDHSKGFGGKYGVEKEKVDRSALGYDYKGETEKHQSQKGRFKGHPVAFFGFVCEFIQWYFYISANSPHAESSL